jgi:hypothetical protein
MLEKSWLLNKLGKYEEFRNSLMDSKTITRDDEVINAISQNYTQKELAELVMAMDYVLMHKVIDDIESKKQNSQIMYG